MEDPVSLGVRSAEAKIEKSGDRERGVAKFKITSRSFDAISSFLDDPCDFRGLHRYTGYTSYLFNNAGIFFCRN